MSKHTPGPWRWEINLKYKAVNLCGGEPKFDKTVMGFERWGMSGATPVFLDSNEHILIHAKDCAEIILGREHHSEWAQTLNHADANLIAAAPDLLEAVVNACAIISTHVNMKEWKDDKDKEMYIRMWRQIESTINKATK